MSRASAPRVIEPGPRRVNGWTRERVAATGLAALITATSAIAVGLGRDRGTALTMWAIGSLAWIDALLGFKLSFAVFRLPRYLRWSLRCRRGRRCADLVVAEGTPAGPFPGGGFVVLRWTCKSCGTRYRRDEPVPATPARVVAVANDPRWS